MTPAYAVAGVLVSLASIGAVLATHHELTQTRVPAVAEPTRMVERAIPISKQAKAEAAADSAPPSPASEAMAQMRQSKSDKLLPEPEPLPAAVLSATNLPPHARLLAPARTTGRIRAKQRAAVADDDGAEQASGAASAAQAEQARQRRRRGRAPAQCLQ
jgi:hypothetical protein